MDFDFHGHQLVCHLVEAAGRTASDRVANPVGGDRVPVPHFGLVLSFEAWEALLERLRARDVSFLIEPRTRFRGEAGEQGTFFLRDPAGNALESKCFRDPGQLFAR